MLFCLDSLSYTHFDSIIKPIFGSISFSFVVLSSGLQLGVPAATPAGIDAQRPVQLPFLLQHTLRHNLASKLEPRVSHNLARFQVQSDDFEPLVGLDALGFVAECFQRLSGKLQEQGVVNFAGWDCFLDRTDDLRGKVGERIVPLQASDWKKSVGY